TFDVVADGLEQGGVHHAAPEKLEPARLLAKPATAAVAALTFHVELCRRLGVRKEAWPESRLDPGIEELLGERIQCTLQVAQTDALVDDQALNLGEHRRVRRVEVAAAEEQARGKPPHR